MSSPEDGLRESMIAHKAGRFAEAEAGYLRVLAERPSDPKALYYLGLLSHHRGDTNAAVDLLRRCLTHAPSNAHAWNTLGGLLIAADRRVDAREAYRRATQVAPAMGEGWYNLGICLRDEGDFSGAVQALRSSVERQRDYFRAYEALAMLLYELGRAEESAGVYREWAAQDPRNPKARHMAAATSQQEVPERAAADYITTLFDGAASSFDKDLSNLHYRAPELVATALERVAAGAVLPDALDAGCGTGLCGPLIRAYCKRVVGVDLSPQMIEHARARGCYDELVVGDLEGFMRSRSGGFDVIVSADTLVYFGALENVLAAAHIALRPGGVLIFTLEALPPDGAADHRLEAHGRYAHSPSYVIRALSAAGFTSVTISRERLREERGVAVDGILASAHRR